MEAARLREWYSAAQALVSELSSKSSDPDALHSQETDLHSKHLDLYRVVQRIRKGASKIKQGESRAIWLERASTLQSEVHELTRTIAQNANQDLLPSVLTAGASAAETLEAEKASLQESLQAAKYTCEALEATIAEHASAREQEAASLMELRTRTVVLQQDVRQREADAREMLQRLQAAVKEKETLSGEKDRMEEDMRARAQLAESQGQVIAQLMGDSEESKKELQGLRKRVTDAEEEAHVLRVNLGNHSQVIEKLILLNAEMMEAGNKYAVSREELGAGGNGKEKGNGTAEMSGAGSAEPNGSGENSRKRHDEQTGRSGSNRSKTRFAESHVAASGGEDELPVSRIEGEEPTGSGSDFESQRRPQKREVTKEGPGEQQRGSDAGRDRPGPNVRTGDGTTSGGAARVGSEDEREGQAPSSNGTVGGLLKPVKWTSDMLPLTRQPASPPPKREETVREVPDAAAWVGSKIQGVGGKARGLLNYVAGLDNAPAAKS